MPLALSDNTKTRAKRRHFNTFGLEHVATCPGATAGKGGCLEVRSKKARTCYMDKITRIYPKVGEKLKANTELLRGKTQTEIEPLLEETVREFIRLNNGRNLFFRLHFSGDFFNLAYAKAWSAVMARFPEVRFWFYSRTFWVLEVFKNNSNASIFLSADPVNYRHALASLRALKEMNGSARYALAFMGTVPSDLTERFVSCPSITGKIDSDKQGACAKCRLCIDRPGALRNIQFGIH